MQQKPKQSPKLPHRPQPPWHDATGGMLHYHLHTKTTEVFSRRSFIAMRRHCLNYHCQNYLLWIEVKALQTISAAAAIADPLCSIVEKDYTFAYHSNTLIYYSIKVLLLSVGNP